MKEASGNSAELERLQSEILRLPEPVFDGLSDSSDYYQRIFSTHVIPIVHLLAQIQDSGVTRQNPTLAEYSSDRGGKEFLYSDMWTGGLQAGIMDMANAADLGIKMDDREEGRWQYPVFFNGVLEHQELPPALARRVTPRRDIINEELDAAIAFQREQWKYINPPKGKGIRDVFRSLTIRRPKEPVRTPRDPDFQLRVVSRLAPWPQERDLGRDTYSSTRLNHTISVIQPVK